MNRLSEAVQRLDDFSRVAAYFHADPLVNASDRLLSRLREILNVH